MHDSDTESEPENDLKKWDATEFASQLPHAISEHSDYNLAERVANAIVALGSIPIQEVLMVPVIQSILSSRNLIGFLDNRMKNFIARLKARRVRSSCS